jgi:IS5 family transposase
MFESRSAVEHRYAFLKRVFHFLHVMVTTVERVRVKTYFIAIFYGLVRARFFNWCLNACYHNY